jgi:hypothetical protein
MPRTTKLCSISSLTSSAPIETTLVIDPSHPDRVDFIAQFANLLTPAIGIDAP